MSSRDVERVQELSQIKASESPFPRQPPIQIQLALVVLLGNLEFWSWYSFGFREMFRGSYADACIVIQTHALVVSFFVK